MIMTYNYNGQTYILQDRLYYRVTNGSVIIDNKPRETVLPETILLPETVLSVPILPEPELSVQPEMIVLPVLPEIVLPEPVLPLPETVIPLPETVIPIVIKKKR